MTQEALCSHGLPTRAACALCNNFTLRAEKVHVPTLFENGDFLGVELFRAVDDARKEAARRLFESLTNNEFMERIALHDPAEFLELRDNMKELYAHEDYFTFLELWDEWVCEGSFDGPTPFNFDIDARLVQ